MILKHQLLITLSLLTSFLLIKKAVGVYL